MLETLITSKTRLRLLIKFFVNQANRAHMRGLAGEFNESTNAIRKELNNLTSAGYLQKETVGTRIDYQANVSHPLFGALQNIVRKYLGLDTIVENILDRMGDVHQVWVLGDYAKGHDSGQIDITILGTNLNTTYGKQLAEKLQTNIGRQVNIQYGTPSDTHTLQEPKLRLYGTE